MASIEIASDLDELPRVVAFIEEFVEEHAIPATAAMHLNLALEELITNVIVHGYEGTRGSIGLALEREGERVSAVLTDRARAYDPFSTPEPDLDAPIEERGIGGLGVHIVREMAESYDYERRGDENRVRISLRA